MVLAMISQPMKGLTDEEIIENRERAVKILEKEGYQVVDTFFNKGEVNDMMYQNPSVAYLGESLKMMARVKVVYFCNGWSTARGCNIEHRVAREYGISCIYEGTTI